MFGIPRDASFLWKLTYVLITLVRPLICSFRVEGRENVPRTGGVVLACNHPGGMDVVVLGYASPRQIYYMAKQELFEVGWWFTALIRAAGAFPIRRGQRDAVAIEHSIHLVRSGKVLGMFPEGTRNRGRGLGRGRSGAVRIALQAGAPIVPAAVIGVPDLHRNWYHPLRRPKVIVRFGAPMTLDKGNSDPGYVQARTDEVMRAIAAMMPPELRGVYGAGPLAQTEGHRSASLSS